MLMDTTRKGSKLGTPTKLKFNQPMQTRGGSDVRLYDIYESRYINGAYYYQPLDKWYPVQWNWQGEYTNGSGSSLDLINVVDQLDAA